MKKREYKALVKMLTGALREIHTALPIGGTVGERKAQNIAREALEEVAQATGKEGAKCTS